MACFMGLQLPAKIILKTWMWRRDYPAVCPSWWENVKLLFCRHGNGLFRGDHRRLSFGSENFPVATFLEASAHRADLGALLHDERRAALGARFGDGHVRRGEIAIRITRTAVENARTAASTFSCAAAAHKFALVALGTLDAHGDRPRVFALGITGAADKFAEASVLFYQPGIAQRALFVQRLVGLARRAR